MGKVLQFVETIMKALGSGGIIAALVVAALVTILFQPFLRKILFPQHETITMRERLTGSGC